MSICSFEPGLKLSRGLARRICAPYGQRSASGSSSPNRKSLSSALLDLAAPSIGEPSLGLVVGRDTVFSGAVACFASDFSSDGAWECSALKRSSPDTSSLRGLYGWRTSDE